MKFGWANIVSVTAGVIVFLRRFSGGLAPAGQGGDTAAGEMIFSGAAPEPVAVAFGAMLAGLAAFTLA